MQQLWLYVIGFSALFFSLTYRIPQMYHMWCSKSSDNISQWMLHLQSISYVLYITYGILIVDYVYISSSVVSLLQNLIIFIMYLKFKNQEKVAEQETVRIPAVAISIK